MINKSFSQLLAALLLSFILIYAASLSAEQLRNNYGHWSEAELAGHITSAHLLESPGAQVVAISDIFLDTPYAAQTLIGSPQIAEQLVIDLSGFDCLTFLDNVEALRRAADLADYPEQLKQVRYRGGRVSYSARRHFFSDWADAAASGIDDVSAAVGQDRALTVIKQLNRKAGGSLWLPGIPETPRAISYIPTQQINRQVLLALREGDYIGIYSEQPGLDVSHTGLLVKRQGQLLLRHASSRESARRVVDEDLLEYLQGKPGLVVYRVKEDG